METQIKVYSTVAQMRQVFSDGEINVRYFEYVRHRKGTDTELFKCVVRHPDDARLSSNWVYSSWSELEKLLSHSTETSPTAIHPQAPLLF